MGLTMMQDKSRDRHPSLPFSASDNRRAPWRKRSSAEQAPSEGAQDLKVKTGKSYDVMSGAGAGRAKNGKPAFVPRQRQYRSPRPLTRDQNGHAGFLIHTAYGRRRPGRYHTILPG